MVGHFYDNMLRNDVNGNIEALHPHVKCASQKWAGPKIGTVLHKFFPIDTTCWSVKSGRPFKLLPAFSLCLTWIEVSPHLFWYPREEEDDDDSTANFCLTNQLCSVKWNHPGPDKTVFGLLFNLLSSSLHWVYNQSFRDDRQMTEMRVMRMIEVAVW